MHTPVLLRESSHDAVFALDVDGEHGFRLVSFDSGARSAITDAVGRTVDELPDEAVPGALLTVLKQCVQRVQAQSYEGACGPPEARRHFAITVLPVVDPSGRVHRVMGVARDITAEKRALEALHESEERLRRLAENIREVFWMTDSDKTRMLYISPGYEALWGRSLESLRLAPMSWLDSVHPADRERVQAVVSRQAEEETEVTYRIVRPDGAERWIRSRSTPVRDDDGRARRIAGSAEDITGLVLTEERLRQSQKLEAIGQLAGGVAHDFNNLLSVILSYAHLLLDELEPGDPRREDVQQMREAGERAADLTRRLLAFGRKQLLQPKVLDLGESVRGMAKMLRRVLPGSVELDLVDEASSGSIRADPGQVEQVILNLVVNAGDAMPLGGTLTLQTSSVTLDAAAAGELEVPPGPFVMLRVKDTGMGMDTQTRRRIFEPFFTTKGEGKGTGLGLPTVLGIVQQSGGAIRVQSAPGHGATFEVYFPRAAGERTNVTERHVRSSGLRGQETILLVDDDDQVRALAQTILRRSGYEVLEARTPGEALLIAEQHPGHIDLLVTDVVMPRLNGKQLGVRLLALRPGIKVLYMSGRPDDVLVQDGVMEPGIAFIQKPITPEAFALKVREALSG